MDLTGDRRDREKQATLFGYILPVVMSSEIHFGRNFESIYETK